MGATDGIVCRPVEVVLRPGEMDAGRVDGALTFSAALLLLGGALTFSTAVLLLGGACGAETLSAAVLL